MTLSCLPLGDDANGVQAMLQGTEGGVYVLGPVSHMEKSNSLHHNDRTRNPLPPRCRLLLNANATAESVEEPGLQMRQLHVARTRLRDLWRAEEYTRHFVHGIVQAVPDTPITWADNQGDRGQMFSIRVCDQGGNIVQVKACKSHANLDFQERQIVKLCFVQWKPREECLIMDEASCVRFSSQLIPQDVMSDIHGSVMEKATHSA